MNEEICHVHTLENSVLKCQISPTWSVFNTILIKIAAGLKKSLQTDSKIYMAR